MEPIPVRGRLYLAGIENRNRNLYCIALISILSVDQYFYGCPSYPMGFFDVFSFKKSLYDKQKIFFILRIFLPLEIKKVQKFR